MIGNDLFFILADGHHNSLGLVRSLGIAGYETHVFIIEGKDAIVKHSKYCKNITFCNNVYEALDIIIKKYSTFKCNKFILTGNDKYVVAIDDKYDELKENFYTYNCGEAGRLRFLMSKANQNELARSAGLNVPEYAIVNVRDNEIPNIPFPVITKAIDSLGNHWKDIVFLCHNKDELTKAYKTIDCDKIIVQHYIEKENETGFNGISINGGEFIYMPLQITYRSVSETTFGNIITLNPPSDNILVNNIKDFIRKTKYSGSFSVDLLIGKDSKIYFLEVNMRNSGWSFPYTCAGVNLPATWAKSTLKQKLDLTDISIPKKPFTAVDEYIELFNKSKEGPVIFLKTLYSIFSVDAKTYWNLREQRPFWHLVKNILRAHTLK